MKKRFLILSLLIQFSVCATLTGKVSDSRNAEILIGASVYLEGTEFGINSDIDGNYILFDVPNGEYIVIVKYIGYEDFKKNIIINKDTRIVENFMLSPSSIEVESEKIIYIANKCIKQEYQRLFLKTNPVFPALKKE